MRNPKDITEIVIHHSVTPRDLPIEKCIESFDRSHRSRLEGMGESMGYHIAYNYLYPAEGASVMTRAYEDIGWHASNWDVNKRSMGLCLIGKLDEELPTKNQLDNLREDVKELCKMFPITKISGHRDYANKTCPGRNISDHLIQSLMSEYIPNDWSKEAREWNEMVAEKIGEPLIKEVKSLEDERLIQTFYKLAKFLNPTV